MRCLPIVAILAVASIGFCAGPKPHKEYVGLNGRWVPDTAAMAGKPFPDATRKSMLLWLADGKYTVTMGDAVDEGQYEVDEAKTPKAITLVCSKGPNQGKTILGIYEVGKGTLRICYDLSGKTRPTQFESNPDTQTFLANCRRKRFGTPLRLPKNDGE